MGVLDVASADPGLVDRLAVWLEREDRPPLVVATSGSEGTAKRVVLSARALEASAAATAQRLGGEGRWLLAVPPTYVAGVQVVLRSLRAGWPPLVAPEGWAGRPGALAATLLQANEPPRFASLVPTALHRLLAAADGAEGRRDVAALASLDAVLLGGGPVDSGLRARAEDHGVRTVATYGMAETCGGCVYDGRALDDVQIRVREGRVEVAGPVLFDGYDGRPDLTAQVVREGWFTTGDLGSLADGVLSVLGRADDVVLSGGVNVPGPVVAERLREHPMVSDAEVVGVPDEEWGRRVVAVVVGDLDLDAARDWVSLAHPRAWAPKSLVQVPELPRLAQGKVDRRAILRIAEGAR